MALTFEPPPEIKTGSGATVLPAEVVAELIAHTGEWARVLDGAKNRQTLTNRVARIKAGRGNCAGHKWETAVRKMNDGTHALYVRHIAPAQEK